MTEQLTFEQARKMLDDAKPFISSEKSAKVNTTLTQVQAWDILSGILDSFEDGRKQVGSIGWRKTSLNICREFKLTSAYDKLERENAKLKMRITELEHCQREEGLT